VDRRRDEEDLVALRERERQLLEEVQMRRMLDAYTQRQMYQLVKGEQELKQINRVQLEELARLSARLRKSESSPSQPDIANQLCLIIVI